jgi:hypothetical protein
VQEKSGFLKKPKSTPLEVGGFLGGSTLWIGFYL